MHIIHSIALSVHQVVYISSIEEIILGVYLRAGGAFLKFAYLERLLGDLKTALSPSSLSDHKYTLLHFTPHSEKI
jgi:hypothetical protein